MSKNTMERELRTDLIHAIAEEARRQDAVIGRNDTSGFESFGRIKARLEKATEAFKPLEKTLKEYWKVVSGGDVDLQGSYLRELETETTAALQELTRLAASVERAMWSLSPWEDRRIGQLSFDDLIAGDEPEESADFADLDETAMPEIDEATGEILDPDEDLPEAGEVLGSEE